MDDCERCHGLRGGVKGNENIIDGVVLCDYCHADDLTKNEEVRDMFKIRQLGSNKYYISNMEDSYLHSDSSIYHGCVEYWPTKELAQAVLDKYQPAHVWQHGDVFRRKSGTVMVYLVIHEIGPIVYLLDYSGPGNGILGACLSDAKFLFNIRDRIEG